MNNRLLCSLCSLLFKLSESRAGVVSWLLLLNRREQRESDSVRVAKETCCGGGELGVELFEVAF